MAMACHPSSEFFVNPALTLAEHLAAGTPLLIGTDPVADALAAHAARSLAGLSGTAGAWLSSAQAAGSPPVLARATGRSVGESGQVTNDIFWDPYEDESSTTASRSAPCWWSVRPAQSAGGAADQVPDCCRGTDLRRRNRAEHRLAAGRRAGVRTAPGAADRTGGATERGAHRR